MNGNFLKCCLWAIGFSALLVACEEPAPPWTTEDSLKNLKIMEDAGIAFAVHDECMTQIVLDDGARERVSTEVEAKKFAQLNSYDTKDEYERLIAYFEKNGGTEDQIEALKEAHRKSYLDALEEIKTLQQCEDTIINYHNTILNTGVRKLN
jgi:acetyl-CoA carboxylase beta subunit